MHRKEAVDTSEGPSVRNFINDALGDLLRLTRHRQQTLNTVQTIFLMQLDGCFPPRLKHNNKSCRRCQSLCQSVPDNS